MSPPEPNPTAVKAAPAINGAATTVNPPTARPTPTEIATVFAIFLAFSNSSVSASFDVLSVSSFKEPKYEFNTLQMRLKEMVSSIGSIGSNRRRNNEQISGPTT